jgi:tetratricopeptide (TPR) repeat protein
MVQEALANLAKARSLHEQALAVRRKHSVENPDVPEYQSDLAQSLNALSLLEYHHGRLAEAEAFGRQALAIRKSLHEKHPAVLLHAQDLAESMHNLGIILEDLNRDAESQAIYKQTVELLRQLIAKHSDVPQLRAELAATLHDAAQSGQPDREALLQESLKLRRELSAAYPHRSGWATVVAQSLESLAGLHEQKQPAPDLTQATRLLEEAIAIRKRLSGDSLRRQVELGWAHTMLGQVLLMQQRFPDARQHLDDGLRLIKPAAERPDASARDRRWYAATLAYRADLHLYQQEWDAALTNAEAAVRAYSPLAERGTPDQRNLLGQMHQRRSGALFKLNRTEDALKAIESAISLLQGGSKVQAEVFLAVTHAQLGDYRKATTLATALSKRTDLRAGDWFNVACTFGIAHQKAAKDSKLHAEERARLQLEWTMGALVALEEAAKRGFFRGPGGAQHLADGDLAPFVEESRFQKLKASAGG